MRTIEGPGTRRLSCFPFLCSIGLTGSLDTAATYAPCLIEGKTAILQRLDAIHGRLDVIEGRVGTPEDRLDDVDRGIIWDAVRNNNTLTIL